MSVKIEFSQLKDINISYHSDTNNYNLSIRYLDNSKFSYAQKNYDEESEE